MHANDLRAYWQCSINITIVQTPMMTVIYKVIWRHRIIIIIIFPFWWLSFNKHSISHRNLGCCCDPLVREASCRKQPRCQAPAYQPRHLALLTPRKLVSPEFCPTGASLRKRPATLCRTLSFGTVLQDAACEAPADLPRPKKPALLSRAKIVITQGWQGRTKIIITQG